MSVAPGVPEPRVRVDAVSHRYGGVTALDDVSLRIREGEFLTLLGPSGCGKTTLLRVIAGFERPSAGSVLFQGADVTRVPAHKRPANMVFQRPTLFPHLDVFHNVAFGLTVAGVRGGEARERVTAALALVGLSGYERRRSHELSGGQMQRIALARALVNRPKVLLLDEPLSALDLRIRLDMEGELRRVHRETGATFVYVTHDQREALALSDRLVVMDRGRIEQIGTPDEIYRSPASPFAARFVGDANVIAVDVTSVEGQRATVQVAGQEHAVRCGEGTCSGPAWLVLRPEVVRLRAAYGPDNGAVRGVVRDLAFRGTGFSYRLDVDGVPDPVKAETPAQAGPPFPLDAELEILWEAESCSLLPRDAEAGPAPAAAPEPAAKEA